MTKKKILILSDSLSLPRSTPEVCEFNDTWPELLKQEGYFVHLVAIGGATSGELAGQVFYHRGFKPDVVIVQVGIVDCAPRFMTKFELSVARKLGFLGRFLIRLMNNKAVKSFRKISYVTPKEFLKNIQIIETSFDSVKVHFLSIINATQSYENLLPGVTSQIHSYNGLLRTRGSFVSLDNIGEEDLMSDQHHLNVLGHSKVRDSVVKILNV